MGFFEYNESMNYCFEAGNKSGIYDFVHGFVSTNQDVLSSSVLSEFNSFLLSPSSFDDGKVRSEQKYNDTKNLINNLILSKSANLENRRGM